MWLLWHNNLRKVATRLVPDPARPIKAQLPSVKVNSYRVGQTLETRVIKSRRQRVIHLFTILQPCNHFHVILPFLPNLPCVFVYRPNFVLWCNALVKWSASPTEKEHGEIDPSVVGVRELCIQYAQRDWDAAALD